MRGRHDRDGLVPRVDAQRGDTLGDFREPLLEHLPAQAARVEEDMVVAEALHLRIDGPRDPVPGSQFQRFGLEALHEPLAGQVEEDGPLPPHRLRYQEIPALRMEEAGGVELEELHVPDREAGPPGHRDAVTRRPVVVRCVAVDLARTAGGDHGLPREHRVDFSVLQHICPEASVALRSHKRGSLPRGDDQVDGEAAFQYVDVGPVPALCSQVLAYPAPRPVEEVEHAPPAVPPLHPSGLASGPIQPGAP